MDQLNTMGQLLNFRLEKSKGNNALGWIENGQVKYYTYEQYKDILEALALGLHQHGARLGSKVSILSQTCKEWHLFDIAIMCARGVVIPIYPNYISNEIEYIVNHSESAIVVVENDEQLKKIIEVQNKVPGLKTVISIQDIDAGTKASMRSDLTLVSYDELIQAGKDLKKSEPDHFANNLSGQSPEDLASIIYTSGTTGEPKGAVITHGGFLQMLRNVDAAVHGNFSSADRTLTFLPLSHVFGRADSLLHLAMGWECVYAESLEKIVDNLNVVHPTIMLAVPRIFEKVYAKINQQIEDGSFLKKKIFAWAQKASNKYFEKIQNDIAPTTSEIIQRNLAYKIVFSKIYNRFGGKIRFFVSGGAPLSPDIIKFLRNANLTILEGYGLTETIAPCTLNPVAKQIPGSVGTPIGDVQLKFADDGEILIKSKAMLTEYYKNPEATNETLIDGWLHTGDIGEFTPEGYLKITDRKKDIIITSGGKNIAPQKIENMMKLQKHISQFMVIGDKRKYLTGVVGIEKEPFLEILAELGLDKDCSIEDLASNPKVSEIINNSIESVNKELSRFETIKKFYIAPREFTVEGGELTPSLKLKKKVLMEKYSDKIEAMYQ